MAEYGLKRVISREREADDAFKETRDCFDRAHWPIIAVSAVIFFGVEFIFFMKFKGSTGPSPLT